jgi:hypothetical protein
MKLKPRKGSWILAVLFAVAICFPASTKASVEPGLNVTVYNNFGYNASPPLPDVSGRPAVGTTTFANIDQNFDASPPFGLYEDFIVKYEGYITSPITGAITFLPTADDGNKLFLDGVLIDDNWRDKGGEGNPTAPQQFTAGESKQITFWFYENGGGAWTTLYWNIGNGWEIVPASAFTKTQVVPTTTTIAPYFNPPANLSASAFGNAVTLSWEPGSASNIDPYMWNITWFEMDSGEQTGGWGIWTYGNVLTATITLGSDTSGYGDTRFTVSAGTAPCVGEGQGSCLYGPAATVDVELIEPTTTTLPPITYSLTDAEWGTAGEGLDLTLTAPNGNEFTEVLFASYGTPTGSNGLYRTSNCDSLSSIAEVQTAFIGKTSATISADNGVFGDPCGGTVKHLSVVLKYGPVTTINNTTTTTEPEVIAPPVETLPTENTTVSIPDLDPTPVSTPEIDTTPVEVPEPEDLPNETIPEVSIPEETQTTADEVVTDIFKNTDNPEELGTAVSEAIANAESPEEIAALVTSLFDGPMNSEEFAAVVDSVFSDDLTTEQLSAALDAVFEEPLSDEKFAEVIDAVLDSPLTDEQFAEVVDILESDTVTEEQVATAVNNILENGVTEDQATELATSEKVLESIDGDQATEIFEEIPVSELTTEEEAALVEAVTNAPEEIKNAFEETIDVYATGLDDYVAVGSSIDVGTRRSLIAATAVLSTVAVAPAASGGSGSGGGGSRGPAGGSGGSGGGSGGSGEGPGSGKKNDEPEEEEEEEAEIEGPEGDEEENNFTRNSIFKYEEGTMKKRFSPWGFIKKFSKETAAMAFTISGSVVVFATLSGETRKITLIATSCAFIVHYINAMLKNDE